MGNSPTSRVFLWLMYSKFSVKTEEHKEALRWYRLAGELGHKDAQFNLGLMYETGLGVSLDYKEAVKWYTLSAEQRVSKAQLYLGHLYVVGNGVGFLSEKDHGNKIYLASYPRCCCCCLFKFVRM